MEFGVSAALMDVVAACMSSLGVHWCLLLGSMVDLYVAGGGIHGSLLV